MLEKAIRQDIESSEFNQSKLSLLIFGSEQALRHKLIGYKGSVLRLDDAMSIMELTKNRNTISEMARELGGIFIQLPENIQELENQDLMLENQKITMKLGELFTSYSQALQDGKLTKKERSDLNKKAHEVTKQIGTWLKITEYIYSE